MHYQSHKSRYDSAISRALLQALFLAVTLILLTVIVSRPETSKSSPLLGAQVPTGTNNSVKLGTFVTTPEYCTWSLVDSVNPGDLGNELDGVAMVAENDLWAVGYSLSQTCGPCTLIEHWDGSVWSVIPSPNFGASSQLRDIDAVSASDIWAVGMYLNHNYGHLLPFVIHWDGSIWSRVATPGDAATSGILVGVTALSANDVWAVGSYCCGLNNADTLAMHWDGSAWSIIPTPDLATTDGSFEGVDAVSTNDVWIVGSNWADNYPHTLAEHWDGTSWTIVPTPIVVVGEYQVLSAVSAVSTNDVWAVGSYFRHNIGPLTLAMHWDGSTWSVVSTPNVSAGSALYGVSFVSATDGWAVGSFNDNTGTLHWNGSTWGLVLSPNVNTFDQLLDVAASASIVWSVGRYGEVHSFPNNEMTLIEKYNYCAPSPTPGPTQTPGGPTATEAPPTATASATATTCTLMFTDVPPDDTFYPYVRCLACMGIVSGYPDGTFRPENTITRGQLSKIVSNAAGYPEDHTYQTFQDIPLTSTFHIYIERLASRGIVSGYPCGGPNEPCVPQQNLPYFRPGNSASRGQLAKIICLAYGCTGTPTSQTFDDVPSDYTFYTEIEQLYMLGAITGYPCGGPNEPCDPDGRPYFRPSANVSRGQTTKIVSLVFFPDCNPPARK